MKRNITLKELPEGYELSGIGAAPEEDSLVVMSNKAIEQLRHQKERSHFFANLLSGPYELSGTGSDPMESDFIDVELLHRRNKK